MYRETKTDWERQRERERERERRWSWGNVNSHKKWIRLLFLDEIVYFSHSANTRWERYESNYSPSSNRQIVEQTDLLNLRMVWIPVYIYPHTFTYIYIYIYIYIVCFVLSELISVARQARLPKLGSKLPLTQTPIQDSTTRPRGSQHQRCKFKRLWIIIIIVYIYPLNGYRELDSYEKPRIYANGNTITSFARELNPTGLGEHIYIVIHRQIFFVLSELISVARQARFPKLGSKPRWLKCQSKILPLSHEEASASEVNLNGYESRLLLFTYIRLTATEYIYIYIYI